MYTCYVSFLENPYNYVRINEFTGDHLFRKNDYDVKAIWIENTNNKYIPAGLGSLFTLVAFAVEKTQLVEIKSNDFRGMQNLEVLVLASNQLSFIPSNAFETLSMLKYLNLRLNQIKEIPNGLFSNNLNLEGIYLYQNQIKYIGSELFNGLTQLDHVSLAGNVCINKRYSRRTEIAQLKKDIKEDCYNAFSTAAIPTLQNPLIVDQKLEEKIKILEEEISRLKNERFMCRANHQESMKFNLPCEFEKIKNDYSCKSLGLLINHKDMSVNEVTGSHLPHKSNVDVIQLLISSSSVSFWSNDIFKSFPALETLMIYTAKLKGLSIGDFHFATNLKFFNAEGNEIRSLDNNVFEGAANLTKIELETNQIEKIYINTFNGLTKLQLLSLKNNLITELLLGTFTNLINLKTLVLSNNLLKSRDGKLFQFNVNLILLAVDKNKLEVIGEEILNYSTELKDVDFSNNKCINDSSDIVDLKNVIYGIKTHCSNKGNCDYLTSVVDMMI